MDEWTREDGGQSGKSGELCARFLLSQVTQRSEQKQMLLSLHGGDHPHGVKGE